MSPYQPIFIVGMALLGPPCTCSWVPLLTKQTLQFLCTVLLEQNMVLLPISSWLITWTWLWTENEKLRPSMRETNWGPATLRCKALFNIGVMGQGARAYGARAKVAALAISRLQKRQGWGRIKSENQAQGPGPFFYDLTFDVEIWCKCLHPWPYS